MTALPSLPTPRVASVHASHRLTVRSLAYRRSQARVTEQVGIRASTRALARLVASEAQAPFACPGGIDEYVISSTVLSPLLMDGGSLSRAFAARVALAPGHRFDWMTCSYECAGWGYVLRDQCAQAAECGRSRRLLLQVVDVDIHGFGVWLNNRRWGQSGFGIATVLIDIEPGAGPSPVEVGAAPAAYAMPHLVRTLREFCRTRPGIPVALPFFPQAQRDPLVRALDAEVTADGHARFGHSFGSDPWISVLLQRADPIRAALDRVVVGSLALNGYLAVADLHFPPDAACRLEGAPP